MASSRRPLLLVLLLGLIAAAGCENAYDEEMLYPLRRDWIVTGESIKQNPTRINPPGVLPLEIFNRVAKGTKIEEVRFGELDGASNGLWAEAEKIINPREALSDVNAAPILMLALRETAGRPRYPKVDVGDDSINKRLESELKLDRQTLYDGSILYRKHCLHCHGLSGDGRGPTGLWINPHPRDFRKGAFKYTSSGQEEGERKPRREDLKRILVNGIENSAMPSFALMSAREHDALISYVIHLSIRGEAEQETLREMIQEASGGEAETEKVEIIDRVRKWSTIAATRWLDAQSAEIKPDPTKVPNYASESEWLEAAARGYRYFIGDGGCTQCHVNYGRDAEWRYDVWGTIVRPRNLTANVYGGGRRPIDLYWRLHGGIPASGMPKMPTPADPAQADQREDRIWDVVTFLQTLPYPDKRVKLRQPPHNIILD